MKKILVPLDGSALAERALLFPGRQPGQVLLLVRVVDASPLGVVHPMLAPELTQKLCDQARTALEEVQARVAPPVEIRLRVGDPVDQVLAIAAEEAVDGIIMTSHGRTGMGRWLLGSVAENVCRRASCPVWLLPAHPDPPSQLGHVMIALDGSEISARCLAVAGQMEPRPGRVTLIQVMDAPLPILDPSVEQARQEAAQALLLRLDEAATPLREAGIQVSCRVEDGPAAAAILDAAKREGVDALLLGSHGRTGWQRFLLGSVAERVARHSSVPVLLVRASGEPGPGRELSS